MIKMRGAGCDSKYVRKTEKVLSLFYKRANRRVNNLQKVTQQDTYIGLPKLHICKSSVTQLSKDGALFNPVRAIYLFYITVQILSDLPMTILDLLPVPNILFSHISVTLNITLRLTQHHFIAWKRWTKSSYPKKLEIAQCWHCVVALWALRVRQ